MANDLNVPPLPTFSTQEELEQLLLEGLNSGEPIEATPEFWKSLHEEARLGFVRQQAELQKAS